MTDPFILVLNLSLPLLATEQSLTLLRADGQAGELAHGAIADVELSKTLSANFSQPPNLSFQGRSEM